MPRRAYRDSATVVALEVVRFSVRAHFEPRFLLHLYKTIHCVALLIPVFYTEEGWAYLVGMLTPAWLGMVVASGLLGGATRQVL